MIPIYRAKKIDSDEYVEGDLITDVLYEHENGNQEYTARIIQKGSSEASIDYEDSSINTYGYIVDPSTLAIHFPDMIDSEGTKIFASLSEDGKGGDRSELDECEFTVVYKEKMIRAKWDGWDETLQLPELSNFYINNMTIIGIQE